MTRNPDVAASVAKRLLNLAKQTGDDYQNLFTSYCLERLLYRLAVSDRHDRFVLKGAMLLRLWSDRPYRATLDLDLLRRGDGASDAIREDFRVIVATSVPADGVHFDGDGIRLEAIRGEDEYAGIRAILPARSGKARFRLQIDIGRGDVVWPAPQRCSYPSLLDFPPPTILAYPREAVVAEKLEAMVVLGDRNSRIKDFFDLHFLATAFEFDRPTLAEAVRRTFERRGTPIGETAPIGLTPEYWTNPSRPPQVRAFARRAGVDVTNGFANECATVLGAFLWPVLEDVRERTNRRGSWLPGGPWAVVAATGRQAR